MPIDCFFFFLSAHNFLRTVTSIVLLVDIGPDNTIIRTFLFEFPWQFGYCACACYMLGIVQTLVNSNRDTAGVLSTTSKEAHVFGTVLIISPFIVNNSCALVAGILETTDLSLGELWTQMLYVSWISHCTVLSLVASVMGFKLLRLVNKNFKNIKAKTFDLTFLERLITGLTRIRLLLLLIVSCLMGYVLLLIFYITFRSFILRSTPFSFLYCIAWNNFATTLTMVACILFLQSGRTKEESTSAGVKSDGQESHVETTFGEIITDDEEESSCGQSVLSLVAMEALEHIQSMHYPTLEKQQSSSTLHPSNGSQSSSITLVSSQH
ncbi:hypothetical protein DM01DRAFT_1331251 [Hesseltinella vesiculosa]|uniref:Uncharacterized protein n=1 Tax=Hesseltinella vesiculosa TaxID=101127 RepID=A0A1X2GYM2_9FUNG|nr:hypothetical protein DM01DRAFT_1331251 [Hesseltinella vesiculosa]